MLIRHRVYGFAHKVFASRAALFVPRDDVMVPKHRNVLAVLDGPEGKFLIPASNIVTNAGDTYYAQKAAGESPTNAFGIQVMCSAGTPGKAQDYVDFTPIAGSPKAHTATYPKTADADADNTGAGVDIVTWLVSYTKTDFNHAAISHGVITNVGQDHISPGEPILTGYAFGSPFEKTANDTLKVFVNHEFLGV